MADITWLARGSLWSRSSTSSWTGPSPEAIVDNFPTLSLEQVYGAITFYLANRPEMDGYLVETEKLWENARNNQPPLPAGLRERLERARREPSPKRA
ncbi:MAG TPA: hypothetical protein VMG63_00935 [Terriglobia bacterium]|nr:hypothetical protein [Terriglobia bacterium]